MPETEVLDPSVAVAETEPTPSVPGAPEGVAPSAPVAETGTTEPAAPLSTRPRDDKGRFIKADGTPASDAEQAVLEKESASTASPPPAATLPPAAPKAVAPPSDPFVFRGAGQKIPVPGSSVSPEGHVTFPAEQVPAIRQLLAEGMEYRQSWRQKEADYKRQIEEAGAVQGARAEKYNRASLLLWERISNPDWLNAAAQDPREIEYLRRELGLELKSADLEAPRVQAPPTEDPKVAQQNLETAAKQTLSEYVEELLESPQAKAIYGTEAERNEVQARYARRLAAYFVDRGEAEGGISLHENAVDADFHEELKLRQATRQAALDAQKAHDFNSKRNAPPVAAPPVVSTKGPGTTGSSGAKTYKDGAEWRKGMGLHG